MWRRSSVYYELVTGPCDNGFGVKVGARGAGGSRANRLELARIHFNQMTGFKPCISEAEILDFIVTTEGRGVVWMYPPKA